jgi:AcrR family transcriptional regulator
MARVTKAPDERRSELIAAAQTLFYTKGYESTSVSDIVKAVGVAKGTFYYYFDSKVEILEALVAELTEQALAVMRTIIGEQTLTAQEKWQRTFQTTAAWKTDRKGALLAILKIMYSSENILLRHKIKQAQLQAVAPEIAKIIEQGIIEGVFETDYVEESAEIAYAIMGSASDFLANLILNPNQYENHAVLAQNRLAALQNAVERVLGAQPGTLPVIDNDTLAAWFTNAEEGV